MKKCLLLFLAFTLLLGSASFAQAKELTEKQKDKIASLDLEKNAIANESKAFIKHNGTNILGSKAIECMPGATYSNVPVGFTGAVTSNASAGYKAAQKVEGFGYPIQSFRFFGIQAINTGSWTPMNDVDPYSFEISFYEDNAGLPGTLIGTETASLNHVNTGLMFAGSYNVYHWDYVPTAAISGLPATFWVSVVNTNTDAWFLWIDQPAGLGVAAQYATGAWALSTYNSFGICIVPVLADVAAPAAATNFTVTPAAAGAMSADVSWTNPALTFGGDPLTELTKVELFANEVSVYVNNSPVIGGDEDETIDLSLENDGSFTFRVVGTNTAGEGISVTTTAYIGEDKPAAPTNVVLAKNEMEAQLSWEAPIVGLTGNYFSGTGLTYDVVRYPGEVLVSDDQVGLTFTETLVTPGNYYYKVAASNAIGTGGNANSNTLLFGDFVIYEMFDGGSIPADWTVTTSNATYPWTCVASGTYPTTTPHSGAGMLKYASFSATSGNWSVLYSPKVSLIANATLKFWMNRDNGYLTNADRVEVYANTAANETGAVLLGTVNRSINLEPVVGAAGWYEYTFEVPSAFNAQDYYLYFKGISAYGNNIYVDDVTLTGVAAAGAYVTFTVEEGVTPLQGAVVNINSNNYTTNAEGIVVPFVLEGTDIPYTVNKFGYAEATGTITVVDGVDQDVDVQLVSVTTYEVTFNVMLPDLNPAEALVTLKLDGATVASGTATGGTITLTGIPNGDYTYSVALQGYITATGDITVSNADVTVPDVVLVYDPNIVIGTGTVANKPYPVNAYYGYSYTQSIYLTSEIATMPMTITHVKYYFNGTSLSSSNNWTIYMGHTTKTAFASTADWVPYSQLTQVYSSVFTSPTGAGWIEFDIADFEYNGIDNLVIAVDENQPAYNTSSDRFLCTAVSETRSIIYYSDGTNPDPSTPPAANISPEAFIPNTILTAYPKPGANVTFTVTDGANPIEGAVLEIESKTFTTPANGTVVVYVGEGADVPYTVNKFGFEEYTGTVTVVDGVVQNVDVEMVALASYSVTFNIKDILGNNLNATVTAYYDGVQIDTETAVDGVATFTDVPVGTYTYDVTFEGYVSQLAQELVVDGDEVVDIELIEILAAPFGLNVNVDNAAQTAELVWNSGESTFADSFEDGTFDAWGEYVQGPGTPGTDGPNPYWYVTADPGGAAADGTMICFSDWGFNIDSWIISEDLLVTETTTLSFWWNTSYYWHVDPNPNGDMHVKISTNGGADWTSLWTEEDAGVFTNWQWYETVLDLSSYTGVVKIAFNFVSNDGATYSLDNVLLTDVPRKLGTIAVSNVPIVPASAKSAKGVEYTFTKSAKALVGYNVYLDNMVTPVNAEPLTVTNYLFEGLAIGDYTAGVKALYTTGESELVTINFSVGPVGISTGTFANFSAYPNPFSNQITVSNPAVVSRVVVSNLLGQVMLNVNTNGAAQVETGSLFSGIYLVTFQAANGERIVNKMIKK